jgi:hypothetical protein
MAPLNEQDENIYRTEFKPVNPARRRRPEARRCRLLRSGPERRSQKSGVKLRRLLAGFLVHIERTLDDVVLENAFGEARRGAFVVGDVELAGDVVDGEDAVPHLEAFHGHPR